MMVKAQKLKKRVFVWAAIVVWLVSLLSPVGKFVAFASILCLIVILFILGYINVNHTGGDA